MSFLDLRRRGRRHPSRHHVPWYQQIERRHVLWGLGGLVLLVLLVFLWQARSASSDLRQAAAQASVLQNQIVEGDSTGAQATLVALRESTESAASSTDGVLWKIGGKVPLVGKNVDAIRTVAREMDSIVDDALPPIVRLSTEINADAFSPKDGRIDLDAIRDIAPALAEADEALTRSNEALQDIDVESLFLPLRGPIGTVREKIDGAQSATDTSALAARLMPEMLGGEGTRYYVLITQNNAEVRSTGGIPGSFALIKAQDGKLTMGQQGAGSQDFPDLDDPIVKHVDGETETFGSTWASDILDTTATPDFPRTGQLVREFYRRGYEKPATLTEAARKPQVDGVISVDPIALSYILEGTGPVQVAPDGSLDRSNAVDILLNAIYRLLPDPAAQDEAFEVAARKTFDAMVDGQGDPQAIIEGLVQGVTENRIMLWSARKDEQAEILKTALSGHVGGDRGDVPEVGIYFNDGASTKMEYYFDFASSVTATKCLSGGRQEITTTTELGSNAPDTAGKLPRSVTGPGGFAPRGTLRINMRVYSPYDGRVTRLTVDGSSKVVYTARHLGRNATRQTLLIEPGQTYTVKTTMVSGKGQTADGVFRTTPGVKPTPNNVVIPSACD